MPKLTPERIAEIRRKTSLYHACHDADECRTLIVSCETVLDLLDHIAQLEAGNKALREECIHVKWALSDALAGRGGPDPDDPVDVESITVSVDALIAAAQPEPGGEG